MTLDEELGIDRLPLPVLSPDEGRTARTRARCHAQLTRRRPKAAAAMSKKAAGSWHAALVGSFCLVCLTYVVALLLTTVQLHPAFR